MTSFQIESMISPEDSTAIHCFYLYTREVMEISENFAKNIDSHSDNASAAVVLISLYYVLMRSAKGLKIFETMDKTVPKLTQPYSDF